MIPVPQRSDYVSVLTKTASIVGKPFRCAMIDYSTTFSCLILRHQSPLQVVLHIRQPPNLPNTNHNNQQHPTPKAI